MKVKWFPEALLTLRQTAKYIRKNFGEKSSNTIEIVAIWDCRREPDAQARSLQ